MSVPAPGSDDLRALYQETILSHHKSPRNFRVPEGANRVIQGHNPLCGDHITLHARVVGGVIEDIGFQGDGCAISRASASLMTVAVKGLPVERAEFLYEKFHAMVTRSLSDPFDAESMGKLAVFAQVCEFPARVKCASLAWRALKAALEAGDAAGEVTTE